MTTKEVHLYYKIRQITSCFEDSKTQLKIRITSKERDINLEFDKKIRPYSSQELHLSKRLFCMARPCRK